ncbi:MAG: hypothetical protein ACFB20_01085 [Opitutales bacterium]
MTAPLYAQPSANVPTVEVGQVDFEYEDLQLYEDDLLQVEVEFEFGNNPNPSAPSPEWIDKVLVTLTIAFVLDEETAQRAGTRIRAYQTTARLVSVEANEDTTIYFYLPHEIVQRDRISGEPFAYLVEFEVDGDPIPRPGGRAYDNSSGRTTVEAFKSAVNPELSKTEGFLLTQQQLDPSRVIAIHRPAPTFFFPSEP